MIVGPKRVRLRLYSILNIILAQSLTLSFSLSPSHHSRLPHSATLVRKTLESRYERFRPSLNHAWSEFADHRLYGRIPMDGPGSEGVNTHGNSWPSPSRITHGRTPWSRPGFGTGGTSTTPTPLASPLNSKYSNAFQGRGGHDGRDGIMNIDGHNKMARPQSAPMLHGRLRPGQSGLVGSHAAQSMDEREFAQFGKVDGGSPVRIAGGGVHSTTPVHGGGGGLRSKPRVRPASAVERRRQGQKNNASPMLAGRDSRDCGRGRGESRGKSAGKSRVDAVGSPPRGYSFTANGILAMQEDGHSSTTRSTGGSGAIKSPPRSARSKNTMVGGGKRRSRQLSLKAYGVQQTPQTLTFGGGGMMSVGGSAGGGTWTRGNKGGRGGRQKTLVQAPEGV